MTAEQSQPTEAGAEAGTGPLIKAYVLPEAPRNVGQLIRPAKPNREWMDRTPAKYAYRCIPLSAANTMGWEILNPVRCEFRWNGLTPHQQVFVYSERELRYGPKSHFGSGVVTWELPFLFRTPPEYGLVVCGPANHDKNGIVPLDGFIRSDWLPFPFTMNWRITSSDRAISFEEGEPIARVFPYPLGMLDEAQLELRDLSEDPEFRQQFQAWSNQRQTSYKQRAQQQKQSGAEEAPDPDMIWNRRYQRGTGSDGAGQKHQTVFQVKPVKDGR